jgi:rod shape-determining protein MreD
MRRIAVTFLTLLLLWSLVAQIDHMASGLHVYLFAGGLFVTYAALMLPLRDGLIATMFGGLLHDATTPVYFGTHLLLFATAHVIVYHLRDRIPREDTTARVLVALFANLAIFLLFSFTQIHHAPLPAALWPRLIADLACSQIFIALVAPWFFALQARALVLAGVERDSLAPPPT